MKFLISKSELSQLVGNIQNVVAQKPSMPILSNVLIEAINDELILTATDLTVGTRCHMPAKVFEEGATTLPAKRFYQLIRELTAATIEVTSGANDISEITADSSHFRLNGMSKDQYPELPDLSDSLRFNVKQQELKEMFSRVSFAVSREDTRYILTGVLMRIKEGIAYFVGTDGKRLARMQMQIPVDPTVQQEYVIPLKAVDEMVKILGDEDGDVCVYLMQNKIAIKTERVMVVSKLLSGEYPDFERVIPKKTDLTVVLHRDELMQLLRQVSLFSTEIGQSSVRFTLLNGEVILNANNMQIGEGKVSMPVNYTGEKFDVAFNPVYFLDILRHTKDETVNLGLIDAYNPGIVTDSTKALFVIMPLRLSEE